MECAVCSEEYQEGSLLEALSHKEILKVCESCFKKEDFLLLKKPTPDQVEKSKAIIPYYKQIKDKKKERKFPDRTDLELREIVNRNYEKIVGKSKRRYEDLIENFNWKILNTRRARKIMREQMSQALEVPDAAIKLAEQGILPENYNEFVKKIENYLGIKLFKGKSEVQVNEKPKKEITINRDTIKNLKISDLKSLEEQNIIEEISDFEKD